MRVYHALMRLIGILAGLSRTTGLVLAATLCSMSVAMSPAAAGSAISGIAPHMARYRLSLDSSRGSGFIRAVKGQLEIRVAASCDGWTVHQFVGFTLLAEDESVLEHLTRLKLFEARDGGEFIFTSQTWEDRVLAEELGGVARRAPGGELKVRFGVPEREPQVLPGGTLFPTAHVATLIDAARRGARQLRSVVFDGSTLDNPFEVAAIIGAQRKAEAGGSSLEALEGQPRWPVRLAYFRPDSRNPIAEFEMSVELYGNGVAGHMVFDYGDFAMQVVLDSLTVEPPPVCGD